MLDEFLIHQVLVESILGAGAVAMGDSRHPQGLDRLLDEHFAECCVPNGVKLLGEPRGIYATDDLLVIRVVSQPRVSQVLSRLSAADAVQATPGGYVGNRGRLIDLYVAQHRPARAEPDAPWYSIRPMHEQVATLCAAFEPWPRRVDDVPLADPVQQIWDLHDLGGEDRAEDTDRLR